MSKRVVMKNIINAATADATGCIKTDRFTDMLLYINYDKVDATGTGTLTVYGSMDDQGAVKYGIGFKPTLTGTRDTGGTVDLDPDLKDVYEIPGVHPYIWIDWNETATATKISIDLYGVEDY